MKTFINVLIAVALGLMVSSCTTTKNTSGETGEVHSPSTPLSSTFKMLTINLAHGLEDKNDVKMFADWVKSTGAEVIAVQQIERATDSKPGFDAFNELLNRLDMRGTFAKARYYKGWDSGNALFCLYPMLQSNVYAIPVGKGKVRRSLSFGVFELGLKSVAFASTDLDDESLSERSKQVYEILAIQKSMEEYPIIVSGNFGEPISGKSSARMLQQYSAVNLHAEQMTDLYQHIYIPLEKNMDVVSAEKIEYKQLKQTGLLATVRVVQ